MKLTIEIDDDKYLESYLSIVSLGALDCLKKGLIDGYEAMKIIYRPAMIDKMEELFPNLGNAIHLGTELSDVADIVPEALDKSIEQIRELNFKSIELTDDRKQHIFYKLEE